MEFTLDELMYIHNLVSISGDCGSMVSVGEMQRPVDVAMLERRIKEIILLRKAKICKY